MAATCQDFHGFGVPELAYVAYLAVNLTFSTFSLRYVRRIVLAEININGGSWYIAPQSHSHVDRYGVAGGAICLLTFTVPR